SCSVLRRGRWQGVPRGRRRPRAGSPTVDLGYPLEREQRSTLLLPERQAGERKAHTGQELRQRRTDLVAVQACSTSVIDSVAAAEPIFESTGTFRSRVAPRTLAPVPLVAAAVPRLLGSVRPGLVPGLTAGPAATSRVAFCVTTA